MLEARRVSVFTAGKCRLEKVSIGVMPGELLAIVGPNGAGKSTLLKTLAGQLDPSTGNVFLENETIGAWDRRALARRRAVLSQQARVSFDFSVYDVVMLGRSPHVAADETYADHEMVARILDELALTSLAERVCNRLSGGEQQRVQIARVLAQLGSTSAGQPGYLLLDEPVSSLDIEHQHLVMDRFRDCARQGAGVVVVLHDLNLASVYADRVAVINDGAIAAIGSPWKVFEPAVLCPIFQAEFHVSRHPVHDCPVLLSVPANRPALSARATTPPFHPVT